jgi:hypothetical protein
MPANYVLLERIELNASASSVSFQNIPQSGYTDLKVVMSARSSYSSGEGILMQFNGSSGANYFYRQLYGTGSSAGSYTPGSGQTSCLVASMGGTNYTASTFNSVEIYIPNYTSSNNKSFSVDSVAENNSATVNQLDLIAGLWTQTAAITSINLFSYNSANFVQYSTFSLYGLAAVGTTPAIAPKASGGNITTDGTYWYHTFLSTGAFVPATGLSADVLVVAGGGSGGRSYGGGGGAGGLLAFTGQSLTATSYTCTIGAGGAAQTASEFRGNNGSDSQFGALTLVKGGGGGGYDAGGGTGATGNTGGSGGGGSRTYSGGAATSGQGNRGGNISSGNAGAGGVGAGAAGGDGTTATAGGVGSSAYSSWGLATTTGQNVSGTVYYAGGGGGQNAAGGSGGGGQNVSGAPSYDSSGTINTGGGAGGDSTVGKGGSGIVIIRYTIA